MLNPEVIATLRAAGVRPGRDTVNDTLLEQIESLLRLAREDPSAAVARLLRAQRELESAKKHCNTAAEAAEKLEQMLKDLLSGNALLLHAETVRREGDQLRVVCRMGNQLTELPVHPDVDPETLERLQPWEYVRVRENVVVGVWADDALLLTQAYGNVAGFKGYRDRQRGLVHVSENGHGERIAQLPDALCGEEIPHGAKLVLQRDNPHRVIDVVPGQQSHSRFEIPVEKIDTRLEHLAGIEPVARELIEAVIVHVLNPELCRKYGLEPLRGFLLSSYKPGMGKTAFVRAFAYWLHELGLQKGFDVILYFVPPNATKNLFHGEDARIVREDLWGAIRARQAQPRDRGLFQFVVFDEVDSLGRRADSTEMISSSAQSDGIEAMLSEMDGLVQFGAGTGGDEPPAYVLVGGMTNLPERVDEALKRPGRMGDLDLAMPEIDVDGAEDIMAIYARGDDLPWYVGGEVRTGIDEATIREQFLRPALAEVFRKTVLHYATDSQRRTAVTAGEILAGVHFKDAMKRAKKKAVLRDLRGDGVPAVSLDDVVENLTAVAASTACQMAADRKMLVRQLQVKVPVTRIDVVPQEELEDYRFLHVYADTV